MELGAAHYLEVEESDNPLDPDWEQYLLIEGHGHLRTITARDEGVLVGYCVVFLSPNIHSKGKVAGAVDIIYLQPSYRRGIISLKFFKFIEKVLKSDGVDYIRTTTRPNADHAKFLEYMGYSYVEAVYTKELN
tara:strand:+ start:4948 stop:5346 length:399 start_codon:yes stop_codon:yes gene_type:complete